MGLRRFQVCGIVGVTVRELYAIDTSAFEMWVIRLAEMHAASAREPLVPEPTNHRFELTAFTVWAANCFRILRRTVDHHGCLQNVSSVRFRTEPSPKGYSGKMLGEKCAFYALFCAQLSWSR